MRLHKKGRRYYIVYDEDGKQVWKATGQRDRAEAEKLLTKERRNLDLAKAGLPTVTQNENLGYLEAVNGFLERKAQLSEQYQEFIRGRLLVTAYQSFRLAEGKPPDQRQQYREKDLNDEVIPYLEQKKLLQMNPTVLEPWIDHQLSNGIGRGGGTGNSYDTIMDKVRLLRELTDFWHRRKKRIAEDPLHLLDVPKRHEVPRNASRRLQRHPFEVEDAIEFFAAVGDLDRRRFEKLEGEKRATPARRCPMLPVFRTLLFTGMRPKELWTAPIHEVVLDGNPHVWVPSERCKTGDKGERRATMYPDLAVELSAYKKDYREGANPLEPFFLGPEGTPLDNERLLDQFYNALYLALARMELRKIDTEPDFDALLKVARFIQKGSVASPGGSHLRAETLEARDIELRETMSLASRVMLAVEKRAARLDVYSLRHSHATWAADRDVAEVHISKQLGHKLRSITGRYTSTKSVKLIDPRKCSHAVWNLYNETLQAGHGDGGLAAAASGA